MTDNSIKITCFTQCYQKNSQEEHRPTRGEYVLNVLLYSASKSLKFLDPCLREINEDNEVHIIKCNNVSKLAYSLDSCKRGIKTICITDQEIDADTIQKIKENQELMKNKDNFICWLFTPSMETLSHKLFHSPEIQLISSDQNKIISNLEDEYQRSRLKLGNIKSNTTIQSQDHVKMDIKLQILESPEKNILGEKEFYSKKEDQTLEDEIPGVGTYDLNNHATWKRSPGTRFNHSKK